MHDDFEIDLEWLLADLDEGDRVLLVGSHWRGLAPLVADLAHDGIISFACDLEHGVTNPAIFDGERAAVAPLFSVERSADFILGLCKRWEICSVVATEASAVNVVHAASERFEATVGELEGQCPGPLLSFRPEEINLTASNPHRWRVHPSSMWNERVAGEYRSLSSRLSASLPPR